MNLNIKVSSQVFYAYVLKSINSMLLINFFHSDMLSFESVKRWFFQHTKLSTVFSKYCRSFEKEIIYKISLEGARRGSVPNDRCTRTDSPVGWAGSGRGDDCASCWLHCFPNGLDNHKWNAVKYNNTGLDGRGTDDPYCRDQVYKYTTTRIWMLGEIVATNDDDNRILCRS